MGRELAAFAKCDAELILRGDTFGHAIQLLKGHRQNQNGIASTRNVQSGRVAH